MIKANELRIGNCIMLDWDGDIRLQKIALIGRNLFEVQDWDEQFIDFNLYPIPLTKGILEKCGFIYIGMGGHFNNIYELNNVTIADSYKVSDFAYCYEYHKTEEGQKYFKGLNYLHELQNLFFILTGKELEIKL